MHEHDYALVGLHCEACLEKVHHRLTSHPQVARADVTREPDRARVAAMDALTLEALNAWLAGIGDYRLSRDLHAVAAAGSSPSAPGRKAKDSVAPQPASFLETYKPLLLVVGYIVLATAGLMVALRSTDPALAMRLFMAGFFLTFSFFKMLDLAGFASAFRGYDVLARGIPGYAIAYPFIELALGLAYLTDSARTLTNAVTAVLMAVGLIGVVRAVMSRQTIRCACLGTGFNLPMSTVTIIENSVMLAMALATLAAGMVASTGRPW